MLDSLRRASGKFIAKIFIGLLILSFAVWGISGIFSGYGRRAVAVVGEQEVLAQQFQQELQSELRYATQRLGRSISLDEARQYGLTGAVLGRLLNQATLVHTAKEQGFGVSRNVLAEAIGDDRRFQDPLGGFSRDSFDRFLRRSRMSEVEFVQSLKDTEMAQQLTDVLVVGADAPGALRNAVHVYQGERRKLRYFTIPVDTTAIVDPTEPEVAEYYERYKNKFVAPEYRKISVLELDTKTLAKRMEVSDQDIAARYAALKPSFTTPERRELHQLIFDTAEAAAAARAKIEGGSHFRQVANEYGKTEADTRLGLMARSQLIDDAVGDVAFALKAGEVSAPVAARAGTVLVYVSRVEPALQLTLDLVRDQIREELATTQAESQLYDVYDQIDDARASGLTLAEVAEAQNLVYIEIAAIDENGRAPDGADIEVPAQQKLLQLAFSLDPGVEADAVQTADGGLVWVDVVEIISARQRASSEVRDIVVADIKQERLDALRTKNANELLARVKAGLSFDDAAAELGVDMLEVDAITRLGDHTVLSPSAVAASFAQAVDAVLSAKHANGDDRLLIEIVSSDVPPYVSANSTPSAIDQQLSAAFLEDMLRSFVIAKQTAVGVELNRPVLDAITGAASQGNAE